MRIPSIPGLLFIAFLSKSEAAEFTLAADKNHIQSPAVTEASGLAISQENEHFLWTLNDSGNTSELHLLNTDGADRGKVTVTNATNIDWEDIASFTLDGKPYLLIADTGDNNATRKSCTVYILREPQLPADGQKLSGTASVEWHIDFTYQGGARDCEAVAADTVSEKIILISKRTKPPEVYELPMRAPQKKGALVLTKIGQTSVESPAGNLLPFANQPTGLDISADRSVAAVVTYHGVFLFPRKPAESWTEAFAHKPTPLGPHRLAQAESVAFSKDGKNIYVTSEGKNPLVLRYGR
ncbi:MAG: hypothetical protein ABI600_12950 [Luteolibacter sp.]